MDKRSPVEIMRCVEAEMEWKAQRANLGGLSQRGVEDGVITYVYARGKITLPLADLTKYTVVRFSPA